MLTLENANEAYPKYRGILLIQCLQLFIAICNYIKHAQEEAEVKTMERLLKE